MAVSLASRNGIVNGVCFWNPCPGSTKGHQTPLPPLFSPFLPPFPPLFSPPLLPVSSLSFAFSSSLLPSSISPFDYASVMGWGWCLSQTVSGNTLLLEARELRLIEDLKKVKRRHFSIAPACMIYYLSWFVNGVG